MNRNGFDIGEYVSYGINGMCNIEDIRPMQLSQSVEKMMYYILRPESNPKSTIFVPVNNQKLVSNAGTDDKRRNKCNAGADEGQNA